MRKDYSIHPGPLKGNVLLPPSKSYGHRAILCGALAGDSSIYHAGESEDIDATLDAVSALGGTASRVGNAVLISEKIKPKGTPHIPCRESGSTLRFLIPLTLALCGGGTFTGSARLMERPLTEYFQLFDQHGIQYSLQGNALKVEGELTGGRYQMRGDISSQFISGLLFALPLVKNDSVLEITTELESRPYVEMTLQTLQDFGIIVENKEYRTFVISGRQQYQPKDFTVEADYSQAAFFLCAGALGSEIKCLGLSEASVQGDSEIIPLLQKFGAQITYGSNFIQAQKGTRLRGIKIDAAQIPDLVPILAVTGALAHGETIIYNAGRLRLKESDRLSAIAQELSKMGASIEEGKDYLRINGREQLHGAVCSSHNDHRIAMSLAVAATCANGTVLIEDGGCVKKSMPDFWEIYQTIGGKCSERSMG